MSVATAGMLRLFGHEPATYVPHAVHSPGRTYLETNCYADILIELLHGASCEPLAVMGSLVRMDFEGDQWTFFKPWHGDVERLYGIDIHEMQPYRPLPEQIAEQIAAGRTLIVELDSFYLPDVAATSYRREHVKSSVAMEAIDVAGERLIYWHNSSLHELSGEDFRQIFRVAGEWSQDVLPPYTEIVRFDAGPRLGEGALRAASLDLLGHHLRRKPARNPFVTFGAQLERDLPRLLEGDDRDYHDYAFATVRMAGAAFELLGSYAAWLLGPGGGDSVAALDRIVEGCKTLSFRLARRRAFEPAERIAELAAAWEDALGALERAAG